MQKVSIVSKSTAEKFFQKKYSSGSKWFCLLDDYLWIAEMERKYKGFVTLGRVGEYFSKTMVEIKQDVLKGWADLNKTHDEFYWWGGQVASKSTTATPLMTNIVYLFCARKIAEETKGEIVFIVQSPALAEILSRILKKQDRQLTNYCQLSGFARLQRFVVNNLRLAAKIALFMIRCLKLIIAAQGVKKMDLKQNLSEPNKSVLIRTWVTESNFDNEGRFSERIFGVLPERLKDKGCHVFVLPMFFNIQRPMYRIYRYLRNQEFFIIIPEHYLKIFDYFYVAWGAIKVSKTKISRFFINGIDVSSLVSEILEAQGFEMSLCSLNLSAYLLNRLKQKGLLFEKIIYPYEGNAPENQFLLAARKYFPESEITGYQHTGFSHNQYAYHFASGEATFHPLPDKIVCSGRIYAKLFKEAGVPEEMIFQGPNLRFDKVYLRQSSGNLVKENIFLVPLSFSYALAYDVFLKLRDALEEVKDYKVYIRSHPLLDLVVLEKFLTKIHFENYEFAQGGIWQDWLLKAKAVITTGASITTTEAVAAGVPVIRVEPDNVIHYDHFHLDDYPFPPVNSWEAIRKQLAYINDLSREDKIVFECFGQRTMEEYFTKPDLRNMTVFLN
ncbi:MAG: hypothetical protein HQL24_08645 [Candidatus Omnitrophica bacterium]|nr:hypothetical protein [Candidatus Omnitrophota bacterium]